MVEALVKAGAAVNQGNALGCTPLVLAAENGHLAVVEALVKAGAAVNQATPADGYTPLFAAVKNGHLALMEVLLKAGAAVDQATPSGWTALFFAALAGNAAAVKALLSRGANRNRKASTTAECAGIPAAATPISIALLQGHAEVAALLRGP